jgi:hypothetical protein
MFLGVSEAADTWENLSKRAADKFAGGASIQIPDLSSIDIRFQIESCEFPGYPIQG